VKKPCSDWFPLWHNSTRTNQKIADPATFLTPLVTGTKYLPLNPVSSTWAWRLDVTVLLATRPIPVTTPWLILQARSLDTTFLLGVSCTSRTTDWVERLSLLQYGGWLLNSSVPIANPSYFARHKKHRGTAAGLGPTMWHIATCCDVKVTVVGFPPPQNYYRQSLPRMVTGVRIKILFFLTNFMSAYDLLCLFPSLLCPFLSLCFSWQFHVPFLVFVFIPFCC
jgi:hypothetical protein